MDVLRGACVGATMGALVAYGIRTFAPHPETQMSEEDDTLAPLLTSAPIVRASFQRLHELKASNPQADEQYTSMLKLVNVLIAADLGKKSHSQFHLNRTCNDLRRGLKSLCAVAGTNREYADTARTLFATEKPTIDEFCDRFLHNMVLGR